METLVMLLTYALCGAVGLALFNMVGLRFLRQIPIGEDFYLGGQGYMEYVRYWRYMGLIALKGSVLGMVAYAIVG
jgi:hypothetical protein